MTAAEIVVVEVVGARAGVETGAVAAVMGEAVEEEVVLMAAVGVAGVKVAGVRAVEVRVVVVRAAEEDFSVMAIVGVSCLSQLRV